MYIHTQKHIYEKLGGDAEKVIWVRDRADGLWMGRTGLFEEVALLGDLSKESWV